MDFVESVVVAVDNIIHQFLHPPLLGLQLRTHTKHACTTHMPVIVDRFFESLVVPVDNIVHQFLHSPLLGLQLWTQKTCVALDAVSRRSFACEGLSQL